MLYLFIIATLSIVGNIVSLFLHYREKKDVFDRFMARNFNEYLYLRQVPKVKKIEKEEQSPQGEPTVISPKEALLKRKAKEF